MNHTKKLRRCFVALAIILICGFIALGGSVLFYYSDQFALPLNPLVKGDFPSNLIWTYSAKDRIVSTPVIYNSLIFIRTRRSLIAINASNGHQLWRVESDVPTRINTGDLTVFPLVNNDLVIVAEEGSRLSAFSTDTGKVEWTTPPIEVNLQNPVTASIEAYAINGNRLFVARSSWKISAYDLRNGNILWEKRLPNKALLDLETNSRKVYISAGNLLQVYDSITGDILWEKNFGAYVGPILLGDDTLYVVLSFGPKNLVAINLDTMNTLWSIDNYLFKDQELRTLALGEDVLIVGSDRLYAISKIDGSILWTSEETGPLERPLVLDKKVIVRNTDKELFLFDGESGEKLGYLLVRANTQMKHEPERSPTVVDDLIIVPFGDDRIFAYRINGSLPLER